MAAPPDVTLHDLNGYWVMSKALSDDLDSVLALQGLTWILRKIVSLATITMHAIQHVDEEGTTRIRIDQTATGGIKGETELRVLDWSKVPHVSGVFGTMQNRSRWTGIKGNAESGDGTALESWLAEGWLEKGAGAEGAQHIQNWVVNEKAGWTAEQIWGFAIVNGLRYHVRKFLVRKGDEVVKVRMVYNWKGRTKPK